MKLTDTYSIACSAQSVGSSVTGIPQYQSSIAKATATISFRSPQVEFLQPSRQIDGSDFDVNQIEKYFLSLLTFVLNIFDTSSP